MLDQQLLFEDREPLLELRLSKEDMTELHDLTYWGICLVYRGEPPEDVKNLLTKIYKCMKAGE